MEKERFFVEVIEKRFTTYKELGEKAIKQLEDADIYRKQHEGENNIYIIVKHMRGNMLSRFTDFLTSDGEKSWRNRDEEFKEDTGKTIEQLLKLWEEGWQCLYHTLSALTDEDLKKRVLIRSEPHLVMDALLRQVAHYAYHVGQIVYLAKDFKGIDWKPLSIPPGKSEDFNQKMETKHAVS